MPPTHPKGVATKRKTGRPLHAIAVNAKSDQPSSRRVRREATVNIRITTETRDLIDSAAAVTGQTRSDFIVNVTRKHAIDILLDQRLFTLDDEQHEAFMQALDNPGPPNERLKRLMTEKAPWEK